MQFDRPKGQNNQLQHPVLMNSSGWKNSGNDIEGLIFEMFAHGPVELHACMIGIYNHENQPSG